MQSNGKARFLCCVGLRWAACLCLEWNGSEVRWMRVRNGVRVRVRVTEALGV